MSGTIISKIPRHKANEAIIGVREFSIFFDRSACIGFKESLLKKFYKITIDFANFCNRIFEISDKRKLT